MLCVVQAESSKDVGCFRHPAQVGGSQWDGASSIVTADLSEITFALGAMVTQNGMCVNPKNPACASLGLEKCISENTLAWPLYGPRPTLDVRIPLPLGSKARSHASWLHASGT